MTPLPKLSTAMPSTRRFLAVLSAVVFILLGPIGTAFADEVATVEPASPAIADTTSSDLPTPADDQTTTPTSSSDTQSLVTSDSADVTGGTESLSSVDEPPDALVTYRNGPSKTIEPRVDDTTGALSYDYPIAVPPGRNGLQPDLSLGYNSQRNEENSIVGHGWSLNIPSIGRINRFGVDKLYTNPVYNSDFDGELVQAATGTYIVKIEQGNFRTYAYSSASNSWVVTDKKGTAFKFGTTASSRLDNATTTAAYRWYIDEIRDTNDNFVKYEYTKSQGQIYPYRITYTGSQNTDGPFTVVFTTESRTDTAKTYDAGFAVTTASRVNEIDVNINGVLERKYVLGYTTGTNGSRSLLSAVTETGYDESANATVLPATQFGYQSASNSAGWIKTAGPNLGVSNGEYDQGHVLVDINGDGLVDDVKGLCTFSCSASSTSSVYINDGNNHWKLNSSWQVPLPTAYYLSNNTPPQDSGVRFIDVNGDGLIDVLYSKLSIASDGTRYYSQAAYLNTGSGWQASYVWRPTIPFIVTFNNIQYDNGARFVDLNGDGLVDMSISDAHYDYSSSNSRVSSARTAVGEIMYGSSIRTGADPTTRTSTALRSRMAIMSTKAASSATKAQPVVRQAFTSISTWIVRTQTATTLSA